MPQLEVLKHERDRFVAFAFASSDMLIELNEAEEICYIDGATIGFLGEKPEKLHGVSFINMLVGEAYESWQRIKDEIRQYGRSTHHRLLLSTRLFRALPVAVSAIILPNHEDSLFLSLSIMHDDIDADEVGVRDLQTGLLKRDEYAKRATQRIREVVEQGREVQISLLDLPDLKRFLDELEPEKARDLTLEIADYLRSRSLGADMASFVDEGVYSFVHDQKINKEEIMNGVTALARRVNPDVETLKARMSTISAEIGDLTEEDSTRAILYTINQFAESDEELSFESLEESYDSMLKDTIERIGSFKNTVLDESFDLAFQPIVDLRSGIIHHHEVLVRFDNQNFDNPFHFINFGEQTGLINDFDLTMCRRTLQILDEANQRDEFPVLAVNLSGRSLSSSLFMDAILAMMEEFSHVRKQVIVEVTESAKIQDMERANKFLQEMRKNGNTCCLDDFGVAESSFDYLRHLHVDYIKIDGSYVRETLDTTRGRHLLRAMVGMCRNLGMTTIGEMVEDDRTASILWESGVHYGQGWLFGKPTTDEAELKRCNQPSPNYCGVMGAKTVKTTGETWWKHSTS